MDKHEAKLILSSYSLGNEPENDPHFENAKAVASRDPELSNWWEEQKRDDKRIHEQLGATPLPSDLRSALRETVADQERKTIRFRSVRKWLSLAASLALVSYLYFAYGIDRSDDYTGPLVQRAYEYSVDGPRLAYFDRDTQNLKNWLIENGFSLPEHLPPKLLEQEGIGCRPLKWSPGKVALMCFNAETVYHLFISDQDDFPDVEASENIGYDTYADGWTISKWKDNDHLFVLTAKATPDQMSQYLASYNPNQSSADSL